MFDKLNQDCFKEYLKKKEGYFNAEGLLNEDYHAIMIIKLKSLFDNDSNIFNKGLILIEGINFDSSAYFFKVNHESLELMPKIKSIDLESIIGLPEIDFNEFKESGKEVPIIHELLLKKAYSIIKKDFEKSLTKINDEDLTYFNIIKDLENKLSFLRKKYN